MIILLRLPGANPSAREIRPPGSFPIERGSAWSPSGAGKGKTELQGIELFGHFSQDGGQTEVSFPFRPGGGSEEILHAALDAHLCSLGLSGFSGSVALPSRILTLCRRNRFKSGLETDVGRERQDGGHRPWNPSTVGTRIERLAMIPTPGESWGGFPPASPS